MRRQMFTLAVLLLVAAVGCATAGKGRPGAAVRPAYEPLDAGTQLSAGRAAQAAYGQAFESMSRGEAARVAGNLDQARAEWTRAAEELLAAEKAGAEAWRLPLAYRAAELLGRAGAYDRAAQLAARVARDPAADEPSKALGWHLAAQALVNVATSEARAGRLPAIKLVYAEERGPAPISPRPLPAAWKSFVEAVDAYLSVSDADPELARPPEQQVLPSPGRLAVGAAKVSFTFDDLPDARRRLEVVLSRWPDDGEALAEAIPPYLQTFLIVGDLAGHQAAAARLKQLVDERSARAEGKGKDALARAQEDLRKAVSGAAFLAAKQLLDAGKPAEAAQAFEAVAAADGGSADAASALHNAAIAWDRAGDREKGAAARGRILGEHGASKVAPGAALSLADYQSSKGDHVAAARIYSEWLQRWPDNGNRCIAMQNVAAELDAAHRVADSAERYLAFGRDSGCSQADPAVALNALRRARKLFDQVGKPARAKEAAAAADAMARKAREKT